VDGRVGCGGLGRVRWGGKGVKGGEGVSECGWAMVGRWIW